MTGWRVEICELTEQWPSGERARESYKEFLFDRKQHIPTNTDKEEVATSPSADRRARQGVAEEMAEPAGSWTHTAGLSKGLAARR